MEDRNAYIDLNGGLARLRGNKALYKRMLGLFVNSTEFSSLEEALTANDLTKAADAAHGIKGMTGNLSLTRLFETSTALMNELRNSIRSEESIAAYRDAYNNTRDHVVELIEEL